VIATEIIESFGSLEVDCGLVSVWVNQIADCLPSNVESWRARVSAHLRHGDRLLLSPYPARVVSRELLVADRPRFERILDEFSGSPMRDVDLLKRSLEPVWVPADAPTAIAAATERDEGERIVAINAAHAATGADAVRRAIPGVSDRRRLECRLTDTQVPLAIEAAFKAIEKKWRSLGPDQTAKNLKSCFVIIDCDGTPAEKLREIVTALAGKYRCLTYVLMLGEYPPDAEPTVELPEKSDAEAATFREMLADALKAA
jgi:hypothetical protein